MVMSWFDSVRDAMSGDSELTKADLIEIRKEYEWSLDICDYIVKWAKHYMEDESNLRKFVTRDDEFIMHEDSNDQSSVSGFPSDIKSAYSELSDAFNPREADKMEESRRCFEEHIKFAREAREVIEEKLDEIDALEEKMERVEYMRDADDEFEHDGFEEPSGYDELSSFVDRRIKEWEEENSEESEDDGIEKMNINQIVYFIAEHLRKERDDEYDVEFYQSLQNAYPTQARLIGERMTVAKRSAIESRLRGFGGHEDLPPLKERHVEFYILPRVFDGVTPKTPEEIGML